MSAISISTVIVVDVVATSASCRTSLGGQPCSQPMLEWVKQRTERRTARASVYRGIIGVLRGGGISRDICAITMRGKFRAGVLVTDGRG